MLFIYMFILGKFWSDWAEFWMKMAETTCWDLAYIPKIFGLEKERILANLQRCREEWKFWAKSCPG